MVNPSLAAAQLSSTCQAALTGQRLTVIVPNAAGGGYDIYGRALAAVLDDMAGVQSSVVNMPAAGGLVAYTTLADSGPDELVVMVKNATDLVVADMQDSTAKWSERLQAIGVFHSEPSAWLGKPDLSLMTVQTLVAASGSTNATVEFDLGGQVIGKEIKLITGYAGSKDLEAAVLRGEADITSFGLTSALKAAKSGDLKVQLVLDDKANPQAPGVPFIAGRDGLAASIAKDLPEGERAKRIEMAGIVKDLTYAVRTVFTHSNLRPDLNTCLTQAVTDAIQSPAFAETSQAQGREVAPMDPADAANLMASQKASAAKFAAMVAAR